MLRRLRKFLSPPYLADEEQYLSARLLSILLPALLLTTLVSLPVFILIGIVDNFFTIIGRTGVQIVLYLLSFACYKKAKIRLASVLVLVTAWANITYGYYRSPSVLSPEIFGYFPLLVLTGVLLGSRYVISLAVISGLAGYGMWQMHLMTGKASVFSLADIRNFGLTGLIVFFITAIFLQIGSNTLRNIIKRARKSEAEARILFEESPSGIILLDQNKQIMLANPFALKTIGCNNNELLGKPISLLFDESGIAQKTDGELPDANDMSYFDKSIRCKDGHLVPVTIQMKQMPDGRYQCIFQDISERVRADENLRRHETILRVATFAAERFLKTQDWRTDIDEVLSQLGKALDVTHVYLFENHLDPNGVEVSSMRYEWAAPGFKIEVDEPAFQNVPLSIQGMERSYNAMRNGEPFIGSKATFSPKESQYFSKLGIRAILDMPITVNGKWWGTIGFDDIRHDRNWMPADIDALKVVANVISSAIQWKLAETERTESERIYRRAIEAIDAVPYIQDYENASFSFIGEGIQKITGYEAQAMTPSVWESLVESREVIGESNKKTTAEALNLAQKDHIRVWKCDYLIHTKHGQKRWVSDTAIELLSESGNLRGSFGILQDITDRKAIGTIIAIVAFAAEQFLKAADWVEHINGVLEQLGTSLNASHAYIFVHHPDENGELVSSMRYAWAAPGFPDELNDSKFQNTSIREEGFERWYEALSSGQVYIGTFQTFSPIEKKYMDSIGLKAVVEIPIFVGDVWWGTLGFDDYINAREWSQAQVNALMVAAKIISAAIQREEAEAQIRKMNVELESRVLERTSQLASANKELEAFSYTVSHDLRAPLRAIRGYSQILMAESGTKLSEDERENLQKVIDASQRMNELIESLLTLARLSRMEMKRIEVNLSEKAQAILQRLSENEPNRSVTAQVMPGIYVSADERLINTALENLLGNSWKYTSRLPAAIITFGENQMNGERVFFVRDNGAGFDMRYADKLFSPFQRLHNPAEFEGHGIGLATVQRIIQRHGGRIWAESEPDKGSTFYFTLGTS